VVDALLQRAPGVRCRLRTAPEPLRRADVAPFETPRTAAARNPDLQRDAVAGPPALRAAADADHAPRWLVAEAERMLHCDVAVAAVVSVVQVRATDRR